MVDGLFHNYKLRSVCTWLACYYPLATPPTTQALSLALGCVACWPCSKHGHNVRTQRPSSPDRNALRSTKRPRAVRPQLRTPSRLELCGIIIKEKKYHDTISDCILCSVAVTVHSVAWIVFYNIFWFLEHMDAWRSCDPAECEPQKKIIISEKMFITYNVTKYRVFRLLAPSCLFSTIVNIVWNLQMKINL